jgi:hypothetical protein
VELFGLKGGVNVQKRIAYFPTPFPNEDFRSVLYRYHIYSGNKEVKNTAKELFGAQSDYFTVFPRNLNKLLHKFPLNHSFDVDSILEKHTLFNIFKPFIPSQRMGELYHEINYGAKPEYSNIGKLMGNKYGKCISEEIRYCPRCVEEDNQKYGVGYIHREHQISFLDICPEHDQELITQCQECRTPLSYSFNGKCKHGHEIIMETKNQSIVDDLFRFKKEIYLDIIFLLEKSQKLSSNFIDRRLREYLFHKGYFHRGGSIKRKKLLSDLCNHFSQKIISALGLTVNYLKLENTLDKLLYKVELVPNIPLYVLFARFLAGSMENFIDECIPPIASPIPFGVGPWCCENKLCPDYKRSVITNCERKVDLPRGMTGKFMCFTCRRAYLKEWRWGKGDRGKFILTSLSDDLKAKAVQMHQEGKLIKHIAQELYCSETTIGKLFKQMNLSKQKSNNEVISAAQSEINQGLLQISAATALDFNKRETYRNKLEMIMKQNPNQNRHTIIKQCKTEYLWLKKHDNEWFEKRLPPSKSINRFSWDDVDRQLCQRVKEVAVELIKSNPGTRVSKYTIINALPKQDRGRIKTYLKNLPQTEKALAEEAETVEEYQLRHIPALVNQLRTYYGYTIVTVDTIMSYRRSYRKCSDDMKKKIGSILESLNAGF